MKRQYSIGDRFKLSDNALDNYGSKYADRTFTVRQWFDHYAKIDAAGEHGHPGFDSGARSALYEADGLPFALYEWEMEHE